MSVSRGSHFIHSFWRQLVERKDGLGDESDKGNFMSRSRSLYCHSDTGPTVLFATEIASEITWLRPEIARVGPEMRNVPTVSFVPNGTFRLSRD